MLIYIYVNITIARQKNPHETTHRSPLRVRLSLLVEVGLACVVSICIVNNFGFHCDLYCEAQKI